MKSIRYPRIPWSCRMNKRVAARNAIGNVLRAVRDGKCARAKKIISDRNYYAATGCVDFETLERINKKIKHCKER